MIFHNFTLLTSLPLRLAAGESSDLPSQHTGTLRTASWLASYSYPSLPPAPQQSLVVTKFFLLVSAVAATKFFRCRIVASGQSDHPNIHLDEIYILRPPTIIVLATIIAVDRPIFEPFRPIFDQPQAGLHQRAATPAAPLSVFFGDRQWPPCPAGLPVFTFATYVFLASLSLPATSPCPLILSSPPSQPGLFSSPGWFSPFGLVKFCLVWSGLARFRPFFNRFGNSKPLH